MYKNFDKTNSVFSLTYNYFKYKKLFKKIEIDKPKDCLKVGIIGELYTEMEPASNYYLERELAKYNISIKRFTDLSYLLWQKKLRFRHMKRKVRKYCKYSLGADGMDNVYRSIILKKKNYDGIIHTKPFGCTPEIGAIPIIKNVCNGLDIPIIFLSYDNQTGIEGLNTRIEAFYDLIRFRKDNKK